MSKSDVPFVPRIFPSRVDPLIAAIVIIPTVVAFGDVLRRSLSAGDLINIQLGVASAALVLVAWIFLGTRYVVTATELRILSGPARWRVRLDSIVRVRPTDSILAAPALSMRRYVIEQANGARLIISPRDLESFLLALQCGPAASARID